MSRYIDADSLHNAKFQDISGYGENVAYQVGWNDAIDAICENEPSIDIVRCKECKWKDTFKCWMRNTQVPRYPNADDFCSYGERKESELRRWLTSMLIGSIVFGIVLTIMSIG